MKTNNAPNATRPLVMKFGGTSVGTARAIRRTAEIIGRQAQYRQELVIVVSAMRGITEALLDCTTLAADGRNGETAACIAGIAGQSLSVIRELFPGGPSRAALEEALDAAVQELAGICSEIKRLGRAEPHLVDAAASFGERLNARVVAAALRAEGLPGTAVDAAGLILTDRRFLNATPLSRPTRRRTRRRLLPLLAQGYIPVVTGFIGAARDGRITTLGRGGSDFTASILGAGLDAAEVWIWTDVDGVMTADPRLVPEAAVIAQIGYADVHELANFGGRVLHPRTILPVRRRAIPVRVLNTFAPDSPGTLIGPRTTERPEGVVVTLLSGCRRDDAGNLIFWRAGGARLPFAARDRYASANSLSVVSMVGPTACSRTLKAQAYRALDRQDIAVYGTHQSRGKNRFSLFVPEAAAHLALRTVHREVVRI